MSIAALNLLSVVEETAPALSKFHEWTTRFVRNVSTITLRNKNNNENNNTNNNNKNNNISNVQNYLNHTSIILHWRLQCFLYICIYFFISYFLYFKIATILLIVHLFTYIIHIIYSSMFLSSLLVLLYLTYDKTSRYSHFIIIISYMFVLWA